MATQLEFIYSLIHKGLPINGLLCALGAVAAQAPWNLDAETRDETLRRHFAVTNINNLYSR
jgi:hypothetical protein